MLGRMALSIAGHDRGKYYLITGMENGFARLVDGRIHKMKNPKKKNCKHIQIYDKVFTESEILKFYENPVWADNMIREKADQMFK